MRKAKFSMVLAVSFLVVIIALSTARADSAVLGTWRDVNPTAYISPPSNPFLTSAYMLSATEGWAVGDFRVTSVPAFGFPAVLHYDGSTWNLVPVPKSPTDVGITSGYALTSVNFGPPNNPISRNDGWAVGFGFSAGALGCIAALSCGLALHWDGVTWRAERSGLAGPDAGPLMSVSMVSPTDVWAVGCSQAGVGLLGCTAGAGKFWHWTGVAGLGGSWSLQGSVPTFLLSVFMVGPTDGWAVGAAGGIFHYFGGAWTAVPTPVPAVTLTSVYMLSPTDGWAVGAGGTIIHYTGGTWTGPVSPGTTLNLLRSVFMVSSTEGWAVGLTGTIIHYSGGTWTALPPNQIPTLPATAFSFLSVYHNTATDGWAVGTNGVILHFDGSNWGTVTSPTLTALTSISFGPPASGSFNPNDGWAVGLATSSIILPPPPVEPTIIHWNGFMWTKGVAIGTTNNLFSVFMLSSGDVWAVGGGSAATATCLVAAAPCPVILHFTGGSWNTITPPSTTYVLNSVFMVSPTEGWAVGCSGGIFICPFSLFGSAIILHYTVTGGVGTWAVFPVPPGTLALKSVFMLGPNEGWAVGNFGTVLHYTVTGGVGTWNAVTVPGLPGVTTLNSIFMLSPTSGWAVGGVPTVALNPGPVIIYWDGTHWTRVATPTIPDGPLGAPPTLKSIYCTGAKDCWAVGDNGLGIIGAPLMATIFHWDGIAWTHITLAPSLLGLPVIPPTLNSVFMLTPSSGWIVGSPPLPPLPPPVQVLSTILRFSPFGGQLAATTTVTQTVSTSTIGVTTTSTTSVVTVPGNVQITIKVVDSFGNAVQGANVTIASLGLQGVTNSLGQVTFTVPLGTYTVIVSKGSSSTSPSITVVSPGQTFTIALTGGPGIPGFPVESIFIGVIFGVVTLAALRRRRARNRGG